MPNSRPQIRYRRRIDPILARKPGKKVQDDVTGFWTYEGLSVRDSLGLRRDHRAGVDLEEFKGGRDAK